MTDMVPYGPCILRIWIIVVLVLTRKGIVASPPVERSAVVLAMYVYGRVCRAVVGEPYDGFYEGVSARA
jgi:hypothetical protein